MFSASHVKVEVVSGRTFLFIYFGLFTIEILLSSNAEDTRQFMILGYRIMFEVGPNTFKSIDISKDIKKDTFNMTGASVSQTEDIITLSKELMINDITCTIVTKIPVPVVELPTLNLGEEIKESEEVKEIKKEIAHVPIKWSDVVDSDDEIKKVEFKVMDVKETKTFASLLNGSAPTSPILNSTLSPTKAKPFKKDGCFSKKKGGTVVKKILKKNEPNNPSETDTLFPIYTDDWEQKEGKCIHCYKFKALRYELCAKCILSLKYEKLPNGGVTATIEGNNGSRFSLYPHLCRTLRLYHKDAKKICESLEPFRFQNQTQNGFESGTEFE